MISKKDKIQKLALTLKESDILMKELEAERDESLQNIRFDGEEELLEQYYKKSLTSVYRIRNNAAALLLRSNCSCLVSEDNTKIYLYLDDRVCEFSIPTIKNILQGDFDKILEKNRTENPVIIYLEMPNQTNMGKTMEANPIVDASVKPEKPNKMMQKENKPSDNKSVITVKPKVDIKPERMVNDNKQDTAILKPKEIKEVKEDISDGMDDFFWEDEPKKDNDTVTDKSIDDEPLWDIDDDLFSPGTVDKINESEKPVLTIKENRKEERKIHIAPVKNKEVHANEDLHAKHPLQNKEDDFIFGHEESLVWNDDEDMGLEEQDDKTSKTQDKSFQSHDNSDTSSTSKPVQSKPNDVIKKNTDEIEKENTERFRFDKLVNDTEDIKEEEITTQPIFSSETIDMDPEEILKKLKNTKSIREQAEIEQRILSEANTEISSGAVFDMSTGKKQTGNIDVEREANKIGEVAEGVISTSKKDTLVDKKLELDLTSAGTSKRYAIQSESDYKRKHSAFLYDKCKLTVSMYDESDELIKTEEAELIIFPLKIPESGNSLVTDICAYLEADGESHIAAVSPGGKTTVAIKSDEYAVFVRGSWENGNFITAISVIGVGTNVKADIQKDEIRPENLMEAGIGHNVLYIDHITTVHIIPREEKNNLYEGDYVDFIAVIVRDYGIDQDCETAYTNHDVEMKIKGERYKYNLIGKWDNEEFRLKLMAK